MAADRSNGWRWLKEPACAQDRHIRIGDRVLMVACERKAGHCGWHCCDNASWPARERP